MTFIDVFLACCLAFLLVSTCAGCTLDGGYEPGMTEPDAGSLDAKCVGETCNIARSVCIGDCYSNPNCAGFPLEQCYSRCYTFVYLELHDACVDAYVNMMTCKSRLNTCDFGWACFGQRIAYANCQAIH